MCFTLFMFMHIHKLHGFPCFFKDNLGFFLGCLSFFISILGFLKKLPMFFHRHLWVFPRLPRPLDIA